MKNFLFSLLTVFLLFVSGAQTLQAAPPKTATIVIQTSAVCGMCESTISEALLKQKGVKTVKLAMDTKAVTVTYNPKFTNPDAIRTAIAGVGYDADSVPANPKAYESLHACCKKDAKH